jgi:hypothetical protein
MVGLGECSANRQNPSIASPKGKRLAQFLSNARIGAILSFSF